MLSQTSTSNRGVELVLTLLELWLVIYCMCQRETLVGYIKYWDYYQLLTTKFKAKCWLFDERKIKTSARNLIPNSEDFGYVFNLVSFLFPFNGTFTLHGTGTRSENGTGNNGLLYLRQNCSHCTRTWNGTRHIVSNCVSPVPCICPVPFLMQCERAIRQESLMARCSKYSFATP